MSHGRGKSDRGVVPKKLPNKAVGETPAAAEVVEGRLRAKGNAVAARMSRRSSRVYDVGTALDGIRQTAKGRRGAKFAGLLHHIYAVERLRAAYLAVKRDAAAGVDGQTWAGYGQDLQANLLDLSDRLARGGYRPQPVKRVYIDKADGSKRPLGVPALEDKIVQRASAEVLNAIYEQDFLGFSYGFRPAKSAHNALDDLVLQRRHAQGALTPVGLADVHPSHGLGPVASTGQPVRQVCKSGLQPFAVAGPGLAIDARSGIALARHVRRLQSLDLVDVVHQGVEPRTRSACCRRSYALQCRFHVVRPPRSAGHAHLQAISLGSQPSLHRLRHSRFPRSLVRPLLRYYAAIRLPSPLVTRRRAPTGFTARATARLSRAVVADGGISRFPRGLFPCVHGASARAGPACASPYRRTRCSLQCGITTSTSRNSYFAAQYPARPFPCQRFACALATTCA